MLDRGVGEKKFFHMYISFLLKLSANMAPDHMVHWRLTLLINETSLFMH